MSNKPLLNANLRWFLAGMIFANIAGQMAYSTLSLYMLDLGASVAQVGLVFTLASLVPMVCKFSAAGFQTPSGGCASWRSEVPSPSLAISSLPSPPTGNGCLIGLSIEYVSNSVVGPSFGAYISEQSSEESRGRVFGITTSFIKPSPSSDLPWQAFSPIASAFH
jgi:hypothetical protein